jgi:hypothetical protein
MTEQLEQLHRVGLRRFPGWHGSADACLVEASWPMLSNWKDGVAEWATRRGGAQPG